LIKLYLAYLYRNTVFSKSILVQKTKNYGKL